MSHDDTESILQPTSDAPISRRQLLKYVTAASGMLAVGAAATPEAHADIALPSGFTFPTSMRSLLNGQTAIVTGAARGIGQAVSAILALTGANIVGVDICADIPTAPYPMSSTQDLATTGQIVNFVGSKFVPVVADTRNRSALQGAVQTAITNFGSVDILVANAGINVYNAPIQSITDAQWQDVLDVNLTGYANAIRAVAPTMIARKRGSIICTASVDGRQGEHDNASYATAKWGVIGLIKSAAIDLGKSGIRVNGVAPATTLTGMTLKQASYRWTNPANPTYQGFLDMNLQMSALPQPVLDPEDIAAGVLYLASSLSRYVSGTVIDIALGTNAHYTA